MAQDSGLVPHGWYSRPVFGLPVVFAGFMGMFGNVGPLIYASFAFIVQDLEQTTGWARSDVTLAISFLTFFTAVAQPGFGAIVDRFGVRWPTAISLLLMAVTLAMIPFFASKVWHLWVGFIIAAILGVGNNTMSFIRLAAAWFDRRRGLMIGIVASATGLGLALLPRITASVVDAYGWKGGFVWYGLYIALVTVPVIILFAQDHPRDLGLRPDGDEVSPENSGENAALPGITLGVALRTRVFWVLALGILMASFALWGITNQLALLLGDRGMSRVDAAQVAMVLGLSMAASRLIIGWTLDRIFAPRVAMTIFLGSAAGFFFLASGWYRHSRLFCRTSVGCRSRRGNRTHWFYGESLFRSACVRRYLWQRFRRLPTRYKWWTIPSRSGAGDSRQLRRSPVRHGRCHDGGGAYVCDNGGATIGTTTSSRLTDLRLPALVLMFAHQACHA